MKQSRRCFLQNSFGALACSMAPSLLTTACLPERRDPLIIDFIGSRERFEYFLRYFRKIKNTELIPGTLERSVSSTARAAFLESSVSMKPTHAILLLEQGKDVLSSYPIASSLSEYNSLQEYLHRHNRRLGLINPLIYYPSILKLKEMKGIDGDQPTGILISCNPTEIKPGYSVDGITGSAQFLHKMVSYFSDRYPVSLIAGKTDSGGIGSLKLDYSTFQTGIIFDPLQTGWTMDVRGKQTTASLDHTGLLAVDDEVQPRIESSTRTWERAMIRNLEDFTIAVKSRNQSRLSSLEGLASIILNRAAEESLKTGETVRL